MRKVFFAIVIMAVSASVSAKTPMEMAVGEIRLLRLSPIERVAVGQSSIVSTSLLQNGQLLLLGEAAGTTAVHIWFENGKEAQYTVRVAPADQPVTAQTLNGLLNGIPGVEAEVIGDQIVLHGDIPQEYSQVVDKVMLKYPSCGCLRGNHGSDHLERAGRRSHDLHGHKDHGIQQKQTEEPWHQLAEPDRGAVRRVRS
jgi:pilus assembly protein CpaC